MKKSVRLSGFKYLRRQRILTLTSIITASSLLFSFTAISLLGFHRGFTNYLGEGKDIIAVYNPKSKTPYTSSVPAYLAERLEDVNGVLAISPEVIAPCLVRGQAIFIRGIMPEKFVKLNPLIIVGGSFLNLSDTSSAIVGRNIAEKLGLNLKDRVLFLGVLADRYVELQVKGIFVSGSIMDDEVLAPLYVGQWLRGMDYGSVTIIRLKIDPDEATPSKIFEAIAAEASQQTKPGIDRGQPPPKEPIIPWTVRRFDIEAIGVEEASEFMKGYMDRYGVTREALLVLSAAVFFLSSSTIILASKTVLAQHRGEMNVLRSLGASKKILKIDIAVKLLPWIIVASLMGFFSASAILAVVQGCGYLQVLSHTVPFQLDPILIALNIFLPITLVSISILKFDIE
ncbi:MAG: ABC transporter permease [Candidatus Bathyarchaeia archaeon]